MLVVILIVVLILLYLGSNDDLQWQGGGVYTAEEPHGWEALSAAVIKQWTKDGRPGGCNLQPWYDMLAIAQELHNPPSRGGVATSAWYIEK